MGHSGCSGFLGHFGHSTSQSPGLLRKQILDKETKEKIINIVSVLLHVTHEVIHQNADEDQGASEQQQVQTVSADIEALQYINT